ncbi:MAG: adenosine kinase [Planctomycetota bacterium]|nr:adenosine kinase [Planctomycetota bacterium]
MGFDVYGMGNALVDIQCRVSDAKLTELAFDKGIMTLVDEATQRDVLAKLSGETVNRCAGGSAANTLIGVSEFGGSAAYAGKVSEDEIGEFFLADMHRIGVSMTGRQVSGHTGTCVVLITEDAQRTMLTNLAVSADLGPEDVDETTLKDSKYVYVEGYLFSGDRTREAAFRAIELAREHGVKIAFTVSDPFLVNLYRDQLWDLIKSVDLLFCNEEEARSLTQLDDPDACARKIHEHVANVAVTLGANGSILMHENEIIRIPGIPAHAIDTTGAGDMYAAGILYGITNGLSWEQAGRIASHASARIVAQLGARLANKFTADEVAELAG